MATAIQLSLHGKRIGLSSGNHVLVQGIAHSVTFTKATDGANATKNTIQVVDPDDKAVAGVFNLDVYLSDAATGIGLTATTASGAVAAKAAAGGVDLGVLTTKKAIRVQTDANGKYVLSITDTAKTQFYPVVNMATPSGNRTVVGAQILTADYA